MLGPVSPKASGAFRQVPTCRAQDAYALAPRLPVLADQAEGKKVPTDQVSSANMQVPTGQAPGAAMQVPAGQAPGANLQVPTTDQAPGVQVPAGSAPDIYVLSVYVPPTSDTTQSMGLGHPSKASHSQCRPGPKSGGVPG